MLEEWATQDLILEPGRAFLVGFGLLIVGGLVSAFVSRPLDAMARGPYVANLSLVVLGLVLAQGVMVFAPQAISGGYALALALASMLASIIGGFFFGRLAMARSRSAYGHAKAAPLAFFPVANIWLMLAAPRPEPVAVEPPRLVRGGLGVLVGVVLLLVANWVGGTTITQTQSAFAQARNLPFKVAIDHAVNAQGLEAVLEELARQIPVPLEVADKMALMRVEAEGSRWHRVFLLDVETGVATDQMLTLAKAEVCRNGNLRPLLDAGMTLIDDYTERSGARFMTITMTRKDCGA